MKHDLQEQQENLTRIFKSTVTRVFNLYKIPLCNDLDAYAKRLAIYATELIDVKLPMTPDRYKVWENQFIRDINKKLVQALIFTYKILEKTAKSDQKIVEYTSAADTFEIVFTGKRTTEKDKPFFLYIEVFPLINWTDEVFNFEVRFMCSYKFGQRFTEVDVDEDFETKMPSLAVDIANWYKKFKEDVDKLHR